MGQPDYGLLNSGVKLNTPFENLSQVLQLKAQQEQTRGQAELRQASVALRREQTDKAQRENADAAALDEAYQGGGEFADVIARTPGHLRATIAKQLNEASEFNTKAQDAKRAAEKAELDYGAHLASGVLYWQKDGPEALANAAQTALAVAKKHGHDVSQIEAVIAQDPTKLVPMLESIVAQQRGPQAPAAPTQASMAMAAAGGDAQSAKAMELMRQPEKAPAVGGFEDYVMRFAADRKLDPAKLSAGQIRAAKAQYDAAGRAPTTDNEPLVAIMGPDGKSVLVRRSQAEGKTPASNREQGRPVTSPDASDLADFDTSLDELAAVRAAISPKDSTGIVARAGATIPYVTQITGWGADAKKRQAVIDRVKQVIGKTLEGGVLRKEDEAKYEKILPNIGDAPDVATTKLNGLEAAVTKRKQRRLDALSDAGYETGKFTARTPPKGETPEQRIKRLLGGG